MSDFAITPANNGPLIVSNIPCLVGRDGEQLEAGGKVALCRCGLSKKKPYCDGTHRQVDPPFQSEAPHPSNPDKRVAYKGKNITIFDNRGICAHAGKCTDNLPAVFHGEDPWIHPDGADVDEAIRVIKMCPSGALSYALPGQEKVNKFGDKAGVVVVPNGPYHVRCAKIKSDNQGDGHEGDHQALCRCGHSKNKPWCDGSHWYANFRDDGKFRVGMKGDLKDGQSYTVDVKGHQVILSFADGKIRVVRGSDRKEIHHEVDDHWGEILVKLRDVDPSLAPHVADIEDLVGGGGDKGKSRAGVKSAGGASSGGDGTYEEPTLAAVKALARDGLKSHHGEMGAMGVPRVELPQWSDIQFVTGQMARKPLLDDAPVDTRVVIGPRAKKPLTLELPIFVSDMSFGSLSGPAKEALSKGAELAGTGICSGEGGSHPGERHANSRYFFEIASARFGVSDDVLRDGVKAVHFKGGQGAKSGTGGHLPGAKVTPEIAKIRGLKVGEDAISPSTFTDMFTAADFKKEADRVREVTGGVPIGFKLSAQDIEADIAFALEASADYIILDGRGGGTGAAPLIFRNNISVPTIPALARARRYLDKVGAKDITLIVTGGLRLPEDFAKALALGADAVAISNSAIQSIGCVAARICNTGSCPAGIATQDPDLASLVDVEKGAKQLANFLNASKDLMAVLARACTHSKLSEFELQDLTTWKYDMAMLSGVPYGGVGELNLSRR